MPPPYTLLKTEVAETLLQLCASGAQPTISLEKTCREWKEAMQLWDEAKPRYESIKLESTATTHQGPGPMNQA